MSGGIRLSRRALSCFNTRTLSKQVVRYSACVNAVRRFSVASNDSMKFAQFVYKYNPNDIRVGLVDGENIVDINKADSSLPSTLLGILRNGDVDKVRKLKGEPVALSSVTLKSPIHGMDKILCVGLNYKDHCEEQNLKPPEVPMIFNKFPSTVIGPDETLKLRTDITSKVDWEIELVVVIGKKASMVKQKDAFNYVAGYTIAQDISARDWQKQLNAGQFLLGKAMDNFCPLGPYVVTGDEIGDPENLNIKCSVNGVVKQSSNTNQLIYKIPFLIERLSSVMTLLPGDIILTGTPGGVGMHRNPPEYLKPGDTITNEVEKIGTFNTKVGKY